MNNIKLLWPLKTVSNFVIFLVSTVYDRYISSYIVDTGIASSCHAWQAGRQQQLCFSNALKETAANPSTIKFTQSPFTITMEKEGVTHSSPGLHGDRYRYNLLKYLSFILQYPPCSPLKKIFNKKREFIINFAFIQSFISLNYGTS